MSRYPIDVLPYDLSSTVTSPVGITEDAEINEIEDGLYAVHFVPKELGVHTVSVRYKDVHIPGTRFVDPPRKRVDNQPPITYLIFRYRFAVPIHRRPSERRRGASRARRRFGLGTRRARTTVRVQRVDQRGWSGFAGCFGRRS